MADVCVGLFGDVAALSAYKLHGGYSFSLG